MSLAYAEKCAARLLERLGPDCERLAVAGSIRRQRPVVGDIDLVAIPRIDYTRDLLGQVEPLRNRLHAAIALGAKERGWQWETGADKPWGDMFFFSAMGRDGPVNVNIFTARPQTWGTILLCRTGSKEHNVWLCQRAKERGLHWNPFHGVYADSHCLASETEEDIFRALGLGFVPPEQRERPGQS
jgi:DNA polymerase (family 10)